jgi:hypothetical protein
MQDRVIILTGTVTPNVGLVQRADVKQRLADYRKCIEFYLENSTLNLVFAENSGFDPSTSEDFRHFLKNSRFRWESVDPHPDKTKGKGFQEFYTLDQLLDRGLCGKYFIKITGRYLVRNTPELIRKLKAPMHIDLHRKMGVAITGFFGVNADFYRKHFYGKYQEANDDQGRYIEHVVYDVIQNQRLRHEVDLLPENALYEGVSGSHGNPMSRNKYKMKIRSVERAINRSLGIRKFLIEY